MTRGGIRGKKRGERGFTLVEIIAVLALIGILAAFALPRYLDMMETGRQEIGQNKVTELRGIFNLALADYRLKHDGIDPATGGDLLTHYNTAAEETCPSSPVTDTNGVEFSCSGGGGRDIAIAVSAVGGAPLAHTISGSYAY